MNGFLKKTVAAAMALSLVGGGLPATTDIYKPAIVANAAETKLIAPGVEYAIGDEIDFGSDEVFVLMNDEDSSATNMAGQSRMFTYIQYISEYQQYDVGRTGIWITADEGLTPPPTGVKVSGSGTESDPYTFSLIQSTGNETLSDGQYRQTAQKDGKYYNRFVFVTPKSEFAGKSKAKFTATYDDKDYTYETGSYYTGVISNGITYTAASDDSVLFVVTVSSGSDISADLTCSLDFE